MPIHLLTPAEVDRVRHIVLAKFESGEYVWSQAAADPSRAYIAFTLTRATDYAVVHEKIATMSIASLSLPEQQEVFEHTRVAAGAYMLLKRPVCRRCEATGVMETEVRTECTQCEDVRRLATGVLAHCDNCHGVGYTVHIERKQCDGGELGPCPYVQTLNKPFRPTKPKQKRTPKRFNVKE